MNELEAFLSSVLLSLQERCLAMLSGQAAITKLIALLDLGQPMYALLHHHLLQALEAKMPQPCVPVPCDFLGLSHVADRQGDVGDEHIQPILHLWDQRQ
jgi:hypothetical protein